MPIGKDRLQLAFGGFSGRKKTVVDRFSGQLGIRTNGQDVVEVSSRAGYVWVRLRNVENEVIQAYNEKVSKVYDLPVVVERDKDHPSRYRIVERDVERYSDWGTASSYMPSHGNQHRFDKEDSGTGGDIVWVGSQQFLPFLVQPSGTYYAENVLINPYTYLFNDAYYYAGNTGTSSLLNLKPTGSSNARMVLVCLDRQTGNFPIVTGTLTEFSNVLTGTSQVVQYIPAPPNSDYTPLAGVRLVSGTSAISWDNIYDVRQYYLPEGGGGVTDASYVTLALDADLTAERVLVTGTYTTLTDGGANGNVVIDVNLATDYPWTGAHTHTRGLLIDGSQDEVQLTIQAAAGQTANILLIENSGGTDYLFMASDGQVVLGTSSASGLGRLYIKDVAVGFSTSNRRMVEYEMEARYGSDNTKYYYGHITTLSVRDAYNYSSSVGINAYSAVVQCTAAATVKLARAQIASGVFTAGTVTTFVEFDAQAPTVTSGQITNLYGLRIGDMSAGNSLNYAIQTGLGDVSFGDKVLIDGSLTLEELSSTPANPSANDQARLYVKSDKFIIQFNEGGTVRYKYLGLTGTSVTWTHTTTPP